MVNDSSAMMGILHIVEYYDSNLKRVVFLKEEVFRHGFMFYSIDGGIESDLRWT